MKMKITPNPLSASRMGRRTSHRRMHGLLLLVGAVLVSLSPSVSCGQAVRLTGAVLFSADDEGTSTLYNGWNTRGGDGILNLFIAPGLPHGIPDGLTAPIINTSNDAGTALEIALRPGDNWFTFFCEPGLVSSMAMNLFFDNALTPSISVKGPMRTDVSMPLFLANCAVNTRNLTFATGTPAAGTLIYTDGLTTVSLAEYSFAVTSVFSADRVSPWLAASNGAKDFVGTLNLVVSPEIVCDAGVPVITGQPLSTGASLGQSITFFVSGSGECPMTFQWYRNGEAMPGATESALTIPIAQITDAGDYHVEVANALGSSVSASAALRVFQTDNAVCYKGVPTVTVQPQSIIVWPFLTASFRVAVEGECPMTFQWYRNGEALPGATEPALTIPNAQITDAGDYHVEVTNALGSSISTPAALRFFQDAMPLVTAFTSGTWRNDYSGWVGCLLRVGTSPLAIRSLGRVYVSGNTGDHLLRLMRVSDGVVVASVTWTPADGVSGQIKYEAFETPVILAANTHYRLASQELSGGDTWYDYNTEVTTADGATVQGAVYSSNGTTWLSKGQAGSYSYGPVSLEFYGLPRTEFIVNGGFDEPVTSSLLQVNAGQVTIPGWTVVSGSVDIVRQDGNQWLDLNGSAAGDIRQTITGAAGACVLSFRSKSADTAYRAEVFWNDQSLSIIQPETTGQPVLKTLRVTGTTSDVLRLRSLTAASSGVYFDDIALRPAIMCHIGAPTIAIQPLPTSVPSGQAVAFPVGVSGECPMIFQWYRNGQALTGATESALTIPNAQITDAGDYHVEIANALGAAVSQTAALRVVVADDVVCYGGAPVVTSEPPSSTSVSADQSVTLAVGVTGECPMTFQWYRNGESLTGATKSALTIPNAQITDAGDYHVEIANALGAAVSTPTILRVILTDDVVCYKGEPIVRAQPQSAIIWPFQTATFRVAVEGECPMSFQWYRNGEALAGATEPALTIPNAQITDAGDYHVEVANALGSSVSAPAALSVLLGTPLVEGFTPGTRRNDYSGWVGCLLQVGASPMEVRGLGRVYVSGNTLNHLLRLVRVSDGVVVASVTWTPAGGVSGQIKYEAFETPVILAANTHYRLASQELSGGDTWHSYDTEVTTTDAATVLGSLRSTDGSTWLVAGTAGSYSYGPVSLMYDAAQPEIQVHGNGVIIEDGDTVPRLIDHTDWGATAVGIPLSRTFIVQNHGTVPLTTSDLVVPSGYVVSEALSESIAAKTLDTFTVRLEAAAVGTYAGDVSFSSSDRDENPYNFRITGLVVEDMGWETLASGAGVTLWGVEWGGDKFVAVGANGKILSSPDGAVWTEQTSPTVNTLWGLKHAEGRFVACASHGELATSTDGVDWQLTKTGLDTSLVDVAYGGGRFVVVAYEGKVLTSPNGQAPWQVIQTMTTKPFQDATYGGEHFVAAGGSVATSVDGIDWELVDVGSSTSMAASGYGYGRWWLGGSAGVIVSSEDLQSWTPAVTGESGLVTSLGYGHGRLLAVGRIATTEGYVLVSRDGNAWERALTGPITAMYDIAFNGESWVAVGEGGAVVRSTRLLPPWDLAVSVVGEGTVERVPDQAFYEDGTTVTLTALAADSWQFAGWSGDLTGMENPAQVVMEGDRSVTAMFEVRIGAPVLTTVADQVLDEGGLFFVGLEATDPDLPQQQLTFALVSGPAGAGVDSVTGELTWQTDESHGGQRYTFEVRVTDSGQPPLTDSTSFSVTVLEVNSAPVLAAISYLEGIPGMPVQLQFSAIDSDVPLNTLQYGITNAPPGAAVEPATGVFTWVPVEPKGDQTTLVTVTVQDDGDPVLTDSKSFNALVRATAPLVTLESPLAGETGDERFVLAGSVTDNIGVAAVEWQWNGESMGALTLSGDRFELSGLILDVGANVFRVVAGDAAGNESAAEVTTSWTPLRVLAVDDSPAVQEGLRVNVPVELTTGGDVGSLNLVLHYDPAYLRDPQWTWGAALAAASTVVNTSVPGEVRTTFSLGGAALAAGAVGLAEVDFRARSVPATLTTDIAPEVVDIADPQGNPLVYGTVTSHGQVTITPRSLLGDNNGNDRLDVGDGTLIQRLLTGLDEVRTWDISGNDLNANTDLDSGDVTRLLRVVVGLDPPPGGLAAPESEHRQLGRRAVGLMGPKVEALLLVPDALSAEIGQRIKVQVVLTNLQGSIVGAFFKLEYPVDALRVPDAAAHVSGPMVPSGALALWNLVPAGDYANQTGTLVFVASSTTTWPGTDGVLSEVEFEVQPGAVAQPEWSLRLVEVEVSADGFDNRSLPDAAARFALPRVNTAPVLTAIPDQTVAEGTVLSVSAVATDMDVPANTLTYTLVTALEETAIDPATGVITWTPTEQQGPGEYTITVRVTDNGVPPLSDEKPFRVTVNEVNVSPELAAIGDRVVVVGDLVEVQLTATDTDEPKNTLSFELVSGPAAATVDAATGLFRWQTTLADAGLTPEVTVKVGDDGEPPLSASTVFKVTVGQDMTWETLSAGVSATLWGVEYGNGQFVAVGGDSAILTSTDGAVWRPQVSPTANTFWGIKYGAGRFVACASHGELATSTNGVDWQLTKTGLDASLVDVAYGGGRFVVVAFEGKVLTSVDGQEPWQVIQTMTTKPFQDVTYGGEHFVAGGGSVATSVDGIDWELVDVGSSTSMAASGYGYGRWWLGGSAGVIVSSEDLQSWTPAVTGESGLVTSLGYGHGRLLAVGRIATTEGYVLVSRDGNAWERALTGPITAMYDIAFNGESWVAVGEGGAVVRSTRLLPPWDLAVSIVGGGTVERVPDQALYAEGTVVTLTASAPDGWQFAGWSGDLDGTENPAQVVMDGDGAVTALFSAVNRPPTLVAVADQVVNEGALLAVDLEATDPDQPAQELTFALLKCPTGASVDPATGELRWQTDETHGGQAHAFEVEVTDDGIPPMSAQRSFSVTVNEVNTAPVLATTADQTISEETVFSVTAVATDADVPANKLTYSLAAAPEGAAIDPVTGIISWPTTEAHGPGTYAFTVQVFDNGDPARGDEQGFQVTVLEVNTPPTLGVIPAVSGDELTLLTFTATGSDADLPKQGLSFRLEGAPDGTAIDPATGAFTWTPSEDRGPGVYPINVVLTDDGDPPLSATQQVTVTVREVNAPPTLAPIADRSALAGQLLTVPLEAADNDVPANQLMFELVQAPSGAAIDPVARLLQWTPGIADVGVHSITVKVTDDGEPALEASREFSVTVENNLVISAELAGPELLIRFPTVTGAKYRVEAATDLSAPVWQTLVAQIIGAGSTRTVAVPISAGQPQRFYRVVQLP